MQAGENEEKGNKLLIAAYQPSCVLYCMEDRGEMWLHVQQHGERSLVFLAQTGMRVDQEICAGLSTPVIEAATGTNPERETPVCC